MTPFWASEQRSPELNALLSAWAAKYIFKTGDFGPCCTMGVMDDDLHAVAVYHNYDAEAGVVEISSAAKSPRWLTRKVLGEMFSRAFKEMACQTVVIRVSAEREKQERGLPRMLAAYGFQRYKLPRLRGREEDELVFLLTDDAWRTNKFNKVSSNGKAKSSNSA